MNSSWDRFTLKTDAEDPSELRHNISQDRGLNIHCRDNLK
jgi:hypothetical protein